MHQIKYVGTSPVSLSVCTIVMTNNGNFLKRHSSKTEMTVFSLKKKEGLFYWNLNQQGENQEQGESQVSVYSLSRNGLAREEK